MMGLLCVSFMAGLVHLAICEQRLDSAPVSQCEGKDAVLVAEVKEVSEYRDSRDRDRVRIEAEVLRIGEKPVRSSRLMITCGGEALAEKGAPSANDQPLVTALPPGSLIRAAGVPEKPEQRRNPGCFDYRQYLKSMGITMMLRADSLAVLRSGEEHLPGKLFLLREHYLQRLADGEGEQTATLIRAMLFGDKSRLDDGIQELFQRNGTAHILAVSGLHVGMLYAALTGLWNILTGLLPSLTGGHRGRRFFLLTALFFAGYVFLSGYAPSVVRASVMVLLHAFAQMTGRRYDLSCAAFAVGLISMIKNPFIIWHPGFQLSFLAILTLGLITPYVHRFISGAIAGSIAIQIGLGPYMVWQFNTLPLIAVFINIPVIFLAGFIVPLGMAAMILPGGGLLLDHVTACLCWIMLRLNELCCIENVTSLTVASPPVSLIAAFYLGLLVFASEESRLKLWLRRDVTGRIKKRVVLLTLAAMLAICLPFGAAMGDGFRRMDLVFVDVGQGDCMHIRSGGRNYLIDGGGSTDFEVGNKTLKPYLLKNGVRRIDGAFVTHLHTDHYKGICELAKAGMVHRLYVYEANRLKIDQICEETELAAEAVVFLRRGQRVRLPSGGFRDGSFRGGGFRGGSGRADEDDANSVTVLWPPAKTDAEYEEMIADEEDENASSLILRVNIGGVSLLATGDLGEDGERELLQEYDRDGAQEPPALHTDILKVGHHGSKTSSSEEFLDAVRPSLAVIQVGENNMYGHPTPEVLERLAERDIPVLRNDQQGAVGLTLRRSRILEIRTVLCATPYSSDLSFDVFAREMRPKNAITIEFKHRLVTTITDAGSLG